MKLSLYNVKTAARVQENPNFIKMYHGGLEINVPRRVFKSGTAEPIPEEMRMFREMVSKWYPWLSRYALDEVEKEAVEAMADHIERSKATSQRAREFMSRGRYKDALSLLEEHLIYEPDDADAWYVTGEVLMKMGRAEEGFRAIGRARELSESR